MWRSRKIKLLKMEIIKYLKTKLGSWVNVSYVRRKHRCWSVTWTQWSLNTVWRRRLCWSHQTWRRPVRSAASTLSSGWTLTSNGRTEVWRRSDGGLMEVWRRSDGGLTEVWWRSDGGLTEVWWRSDGGLTEVWWRSDGGLMEVWWRSRAPSIPQPLSWNVNLQLDDISSSWVTRLFEVSRNLRLERSLISFHPERPTL